MKSVFTFTLFLLLNSTIIHAQSLKLIDLNGNDVTNTTYSDVVDTSSLDPYEFDLDVINLSNNAMSISCARTANMLVPQSESYFCWDVCYLPIVSVAFSPLTVNAHDTISSYFHAYFKSNFQSGTSTVRFRFANTSNASDTASITLIFYAGTLGVKSVRNATNDNTLNAFPNPANAFTRIKYKMDSAKDAELKISNELGQIVYEQQLQSAEGIVKLETLDFKPGIYFYSLYQDNSCVENKKLIISQ